MFCSFGFYDLSWYKCWNLFLKSKNNLKNPFSWTKSIQEIDEPISSIDANTDGLVFTTDNGLFEYSYLYNQLNQIETQVELEQANNIFISGNDYWFSEGNISIYLEIMNCY